MGQLKNRLLLLVLSGFLSPGSQALFAQSTASIAKEFEALGPEKKELFTKIADDLRCPTCTGLSINQSDAPFSLQIRQAVLDQVTEGKSKDEIISYFTERYGLWILREPPKKGFHFLAWLLPALVFLLGPLGVWFFVWRRRIVSDTHGIRPTSQILQELETELEALRSSSSMEGRRQ